MAIPDYQALILPLLKRFGGPPRRIERIAIDQARVLRLGRAAKAAILLSQADFVARSRGLIRFLNTSPISNSGGKPSGGEPQLALFC